MLNLTKTYKQFGLALKASNKSFFIFLFFYFTLYSSAQNNLVPNPSFEDYSICPDSVYDLQLSNWIAFRNTPDYFNTCASIATGVNIPNTLGGVDFQMPFHGNAFIGLWSGNIFDYREIIATKLIAPVIQGKIYEFRMRVCLSNTMNLGINHIGVVFTNVYYSINNPIPILNDNTIGTERIISDTTDWTMISGLFIPDSTFEYLSLGNFYSDANTDTLMQSSGLVSYYYIDSVYLGEISISSVNVFTPNNDGVNDLLYFDFLPKGCEVTIYNRWGVVIYSFIGSKDGWDGRSTSGEICTSGTYYYTIKISEKIIKKGFVHLIRD